MGIAVPHRIGRHVHPDARPDLPPPPATATGIDYLALVAAGHRAQLAARINYTDLPTTSPPDQDAAQDAVPDAEIEEGGEIDEGLEAELACFAALLSPHRHQVADGELPGRLDLTQLTDDPTDHNHGNQGQR